MRNVSFDSGLAWRNGREPVSLPVALETAGVQRKPVFARNRPHSAFVVQLLATAERDPQTRLVRRAHPNDAKLSYMGRRNPAELGLAGQAISKSV